MLTHSLLFELFSKYFLTFAQDTSISGSISITLETAQVSYSIFAFDQDNSTTGLFLLFHCLVFLMVTADYDCFAGVQTNSSGDTNAIISYGCKEFLYSGEPMLSIGSSVSVFGEKPDVVVFPISRFVIFIPFLQTYRSETKVQLSVIVVDKRTGTQTGNPGTMTVFLPSQDGFDSFSVKVCCKIFYLFENIQRSKEVLGQLYPLISMKITPVSSSNFLPLLVLRQLILLS